ncbi:Peripheral-type benzodiazepine receptor and related proteins [Phaffia rhodozyma]|uniref:Peripheral-type benzodiazepine receptor and related proteins n=1 Tax=Phaffia rhodozyma TaxID=264483 RepID=A0A0F7STX6_PHARH|nr:Peripheral-type benzodiazepine receptor and related proteins [Phaffia rhodozyma]
MPSISTLLWDSPRNPYLAVGIPLLIGGATSYAVNGTKPNGLRNTGTSTWWYNSLKAPKGEVSSEAHAYAWPALYAAAGFGSYLIAQNLDVPGAYGSINPAARATAIDALNLYWIAIGLNTAWSPLFFGLRQPALAAVDLLALSGVIGALTVKAHSLPTIHNIPTSLFFVPYLCWVSYSTYLSAGYWWNNYGPGKRI